MTSYPRPPWRLRGSLLVSLFVARANELPPTQRPPLRVAGRALVGVAFATYEPGGDLAYDEILVAVPTVALFPTIAQIWVDSPASRDGARALWGIPKDLARFGEDAGIAALSARAGRGVPLPPLALPIVQREHFVLNLIRGRVRPMRADWRFAADGPLGWLHGRRPLVSFAMTDARLTFGLVSR